MTTRKCVNYYQVLSISILFYNSLDRYKTPIKKKSIEIFKNDCIISMSILKNIHLYGVSAVKESLVSSAIIHSTDYGLLMFFLYDNCLQKFSLYLCLYQ